MMYAWVRFINKTKHDTVYIQPEEERPGVLLLRNAPSRYIYTPAGTFSVGIFSPSGIKITTMTFSIFPGRLQTVVLE